MIAELGIQGGAIRTSVELMAATAAIRSSMGTRVPPQAAARLEQLLATGRQHLGAGFESAFERGAAMDFADAVAHGHALLAELRQAAE